MTSREITMNIRVPSLSGLGRRFAQSYGTRSVPTTMPFTVVPIV